MNKKFFYSSLLEDFIFYLCCLNFNEAIIRFKKFKKSDFKKLILKIIELRLSGIFLEFLKQVEEIPFREETFYKRFLKRHSFVTKKNILFYEDCINISNQLEKNKLTNKFLKGVPLSLNNYKKINLREIRDIDLLVEQSELKSVIQELENIGFYWTKNPKIKLKEIELDSNKYYDTPELINANGTKIELHFQLGKVRPELEEIIRKEILSCSEKACIGNNRLSVADNLSNFMHLLYHGISKELFNPGPVFITDVCFLLSEVDHHDLLKKIYKAGLTKEFYLIISIINVYSKTKYFTKELEELNFYSNQKEEISSSKNLLMNRIIGNEFVPYFLSTTFKQLFLLFFNLLFVTKTQLSHKYSTSKKNLNFWKLNSIRLLEISKMFFKQLFKILFLPYSLKEIKDLRKLNKYLA